MHLLDLLFLSLILHLPYLDTVSAVSLTRLSNNVDPAFRSNSLVYLIRESNMVPVLLL
jgi:hypothetical protein